MGLQLSRQNSSKRWMVEPIGGGAFSHAPGMGWAAVVDGVASAGAAHPQHSEGCYLYPRKHGPPDSRCADIDVPILATGAAASAL